MMWAIRRRHAFSLELAEATAGVLQLPSTGALQVTAFGLSTLIITYFSVLSVLYIMCCGFSPARALSQSQRQPHGRMGSGYRGYVQGEKDEG